MKIPPKSNNSKYGLSGMKIGQKKSFPYSNSANIRLSAHFTAKRYGWKFVTRKVGDKVVVFRTE